MQLEALVSFVQYETTFVSLGTGGGKTFIYKVLPDLINKLNITTESFAAFLIISPLLALIKAQVNLFGNSAI